VQHEELAEVTYIYR